MWDKHGDPIREEYATPTGSGLLATRRYDELGRLIHATYTNPTLPLPVNDRTVATERAYDSLARVRLESTAVGAGPPVSVRHNWVLVGDRWERRTTRTAGGQTEWLEAFDEAQRLRSQTWLVAGNPGRSIVYQWIGDWYAGRVHSQHGQARSVQELVQHDPFGLPKEVTYGWGAAQGPPAPDRTRP